MTDQKPAEKRSGAKFNSTLGITERVSPLTLPWTGELRVRFSDFLVNELGEDGKVIHLQTVGLGQDPAQEQVSLQRRAEKTTDQSQPKAEFSEQPQQPEPQIDIPESDIIALSDLTSRDFADKVVRLFKEGPFDEKSQNAVTSEDMDDRQKRGQVHHEIRRIFHSRIDTSTNDSGAIKATLVPPRSKNKRRGGGGGGGGARGRGPRDERPAGEYLHFTLYKENRDTMDAINQVARLLRVKPQTVNYAGTKDRRACTVQRCSVRYQRDRALAGINGKLWGVTTGDYEYKDAPIHLGQLLGNEFTIVLKDCQAVASTSSGSSAQEVITRMTGEVGATLKQMSENGWINYFGNQRFGTHEIGTHEIGKLILSERFEAAVNALLSYDQAIAERAEKGETLPDGAGSGDRDNVARHHACMLFQTDKDVKRALEIMPRRFTAETSLLKHLTRQGSSTRRDFVGALIFITRGLRSMYLHAYQSIVWNHAASKRWELYGSRVVKGDLVIVEAKTIPKIEGQDEDGYDIINPVEDDGEVQLEARALTEEEANSGRFTIHDVVLPSPGYEVIYPDNEIGTFYRDFMGREENGRMDPYNMRRRHREFSLPGRYRKLTNRFLAEPSIEFRVYRDDAEQMYPTDLDNLSNKSKGSSSSSSLKRGAEYAGDGDAGQDAKRARLGQPVPISGDADVQGADGKGEQHQEAVTNARTAEGSQSGEKVAAILKFQLGRSAYATVVLRELMGDPPSD